MANAVLVLMWIGLTAYVVLGGADFGAGFWDLWAGGAVRGVAQRALIEHTIGPVWEANHVWLIYVLVVLWTGFPAAFAAIMSTLFIPLMLAAAGIILRGSGFAFRKVTPTLQARRIFGAMFALSSILTPFCLGAVAGGVASGRVPPGNAAGDPITSWVNPTSILGGVLAVATCAYLAAVFLTHEAERTARRELVDAFRGRALAMAIAAGCIALAGIGVLAADAPRLAHGLTGRALPLIVASAAAGAMSFALVARRRFREARVAAVVAVAAVLWGWAAGQYPFILEPSLRIAAGAAPRATLQALLIVLVAGSALVVPALGLLLRMTASNGADGTLSSSMRP